MVTLVTDRTAADISEAFIILAAMRNGTATTDQVTKFNAGLHGCWGWIDIIRVANACATPASTLRKRGINITIDTIYYNRNYT